MIDFAAPYFDLSGISIALRKKVPIQSFFKFALVFTPGVWVSILSAVLIVSALLWSLEWLSPYSYYNNMDQYPGTNCIKIGLPENAFSVREKAFWGALHKIGRFRNVPTESTNLGE